MVESSHSSPRRTSILMLLLVFVFIMMICVVPFVIDEPEEPVVYFSEPAAAPLFGEAQPEPVLIFTEPTPNISPPMVVHILQHGESLNDVAQNYGVTINELVAANPGLAEQNIVPGAEINIRPQEVVVIVDTGNSQTQPLFPTPVPVQSSTTYIVQPGDTLSGIASRYNLTTQMILATNPQLTNPDLLLPGQVITLPIPSILPITGGEVSLVVEPEAVVYIVKRGDTFAKIAAAFNLNLQTLIAENPQIEDPSRIYPGQSIIIPRQ
jgi:peptidoglycan DL-endopeptidase CwlS